MTDKQLSENQKKYVIENYKKQSLNSIAKQLGVNVKYIEKIISDYEAIEKTADIQPDLSKKDSSFVLNKYLKFALILAGLILLFYFGYYWRMYPIYQYPNTMLDYDYAFHLRMTEEVLKTGHVPAIDKMSWYPEGKPIPENLPVVLYYLGAGFYKIYHVFSDGSVQRSVELFYAILCAMTMIPIYFILRRITGKDYISFIGAALAAVMPGNLVRTLATRYRYEGPGVFFLLFNIYFFIKAMDEKDDKKCYIYSIISAFFMLLSVGTWRISLLFPTLYSIIFLLIVFLKRADRNIVIPFSFLFGGLAISFLGFDFLSSQRYIFSHNGMLITGLAISTLLTKWWNKEKNFKFDPFYLMVPFILVLFIPMLHLSTGYESFIKVLLLKLGIGQITGIENILFINTAELSSVPLKDIFKWDMCSWGGIFIFLYPLSILIFRNKKDKISIGELIIAVFFFSIFFLTLMFYRNKVLLSIFVALAGAISVDRTINFLKNSPLRNMAIAALMVLCTTLIVGSGWKTGVYMTKLRLDLRPHLEDALIKLEKLNPDRLPVISYWSYGYVIQTYAQSATFLDGLLESKLVHKRLVEMSQLLLQNDEEKFYQYCKNLGMGIYFVDKYVSRTQLYALYAEYNYPALFQQNGIPTELGKSTIRARSIYLPETLKRFKLLYSNQRFNIYKIL